MSVFAAGRALLSDFVLASASPRRKRILQTLGLHFDVVVSNLDELLIEGESAQSAVCRLAGEKARAVGEGHGGRWVLGADTAVVVDDEIFGKPRDEEHAREMLRELSGRVHRVLSGVALAREGEVVGDFAISTEVAFNELSEGMIARYVASQEGVDKAGGYAIQGLASGFVREIRGSYSNVVGLPAAETVALLLEHGVVAQWP